MTKTIQHLRGTTAQNAAFTGASGEITVDTQTHELRVHDGTTAGGHRIYTKAEVDTALSAKADSATTVDTTSNQSVGGIKTFSSTPIVTVTSANDSTGFFIKSLDVDRSIAPATGLGVGQYRVVDKNDNSVATFGSEFYENGTIVAKMQVINASNQNAAIRLNISTGGSASVSFPADVWKQLAHSSMPDFSSAVTLSNISSYQQVSEDGYIWWTGTGGGSWTDVGIKISLDGSADNTYINIPNIYGVSMMIPVSKGVYVKKYGSTSSIKFIPCKKGA